MTHRVNLSAVRRANSTNYHGWSIAYRGVQPMLIDGFSFNELLWP